MSILEKVENRQALISLTADEQKQLSEEIREFLIRQVSDSGGHLASNLGIVETTIAIHNVFDTAEDRLVFDVGHQSYVHKILTGRAGEFSTLRQYNGLCGFPKPEESIHDAFIAGHASNAVSVALGMARARTRAGKSHHVIALLGDGALTGGLAYEGLNDAGASGEKLIIILNDNGMSIAKNVGGMSKHLALLRLKPGYFSLKRAFHKFTQRVPGGRVLHNAVHRVKSSLKRSLIGTTIFEEMGLTYLGPVDGHDIEKVTYLLQVAKDMEGPTVVHVITKKGKGYIPAENAPQNYHGVSQFNPDVGVVSSGKAETFSKVFGEELCCLAEENPSICAVTAAMRQGTGLEDFAAKFPDRFFDVGIAEGHAVSMASGLAAGGAIPVVALYSTFLQRAYDMLLHDVALMNNHVVFAIDRCGLVGEDGATHHGAFDVGYLSQIPNLTILTPASATELRSMLRSAIYDYNGPVAVRYSRSFCCTEEELNYTNPQQASVAMVCYGTISKNVIAAAQMLSRQNVACKVLRLTKIKPVPVMNVIETSKDCDLLVVVEETAHNGCVGCALTAALDAQNVGCRKLLINLGDRFIAHGSNDALHKEAGLDSQSIAKQVMEVLKNEK